MGDGELLQAQVERKGLCNQIYHTDCMELLAQIPDNYGFMGTGSTALAAIQTQRAYLGAEIDKAYFEIAQNRMKEVEKRNVTNYF